MRYNISYATDNNYARHVAASLVSLFENNPNIVFDIYILTNCVKQEHLNHLNTIAVNYSQNITFIPIDNLFNKFSDLSLSINNLTISTYSRLFLSEVLPEEIDKILYLDCDIIINGNIIDIWKYNIEDFYLAGVIDTMYPNYKTSIFLPQDKPYINAGVLFINLTKWRDNVIEKDFVNFINKFDGNVPHLDQGVINGVFHEKVILDLKYNVQTPIFLFKKYENLLNFFSLEDYYSYEEVSRAKTEPIIIHYSAFFADRPWFTFCLHPLKKLYLKYLKLTPYGLESVSNNSNSTLIKKIKSLLFVYAQSIYLKIR